MTICGVASRLEVVSDFTALMIAPNTVFLPMSPAKPAKPPVAESSDAAAASCRLLPSELFCCVTTVSPLTVVDRKSVVQGQSVAVRVDRGGGRINKTKK